MARPPIVNPDRRAVGPEQPVGAADRTFPCRALMFRAATGRRKTRRAARGCRAGAPRFAGAGRASSVARNASAISSSAAARPAALPADRAKPIASSPTRSAPRASGHEQRRRGFESAIARSGICCVEIRHERRRSPVEGAGTSAAFGVRWQPRIGSQLVEAVGRTSPAGRRCADCARRAERTIPPVTSRACW